MEKDGECLTMFPDFALDYESHKQYTFPNSMVDYNSEPNFSPHTPSGTPPKPESLTLTALPSAPVALLLYLKMIHIRCYACLES